MKKMKWICLLIFLVGVIYVSHKLDTIVTATLAKEPVVVVVDAGHGGEDPGKVGVNDSLEKDINLMIAKKLEILLTGEGIEVLMTRKGDEALAQGKSGDLKKRVEMINESNAVLAVSIHQNSFQDESESGAQVFYYTQSESSMEFAEVLQNSLKCLDQNNRREKRGNDSYYLLKHAEIPTVIVECGFLSNWKEAELLLEESYQEALAQAICDGILQFLMQKEMSSPM